MRGAVPDPFRDCQPVGIIPAHAGSRVYQSLCLSCHRDHPRACGEQSGYRGNGETRPGSSPRMRGAGKSACKAYIDVGIIPAHAGSSRWGSWSHRWAWDHPRACGEQTPIEVLVTKGEGSSPRMRGAACTPPVLSNGIGIIPAHAGSSSRAYTTIGTSRDHPRACGEQHL